jgi:hypothetical protein
MAVRRSKGFGMMVRKNVKFFPENIMVQVG